MNKFIFLPEIMNICLFWQKTCPYGRGYHTKEIFMKKRPVILGVLLTFGLAFAGCPTDDDGGGDNDDGTAYLGNTLELSGQVYLASSTDTGVSYEKFNGDRMFPDYSGGSGEITSGKLSYSIGTPDELQAFYDYYYYEDDTYNNGWGGFFDEYYDNVEANNVNVRGLVLDIGYSGYNSSWNLSKENETASVRGNSASGTFERVSYVYVESDVTVSGTGKTTIYNYNSNWGIVTDNIVYTTTYTTGNLNLALKAGWNAVYTKSEFEGTFTGTYGNATSFNYTNIVTMSLKNPSLKWVLWGDPNNNYGDGGDDDGDDGDINDGTAYLGNTLELSGQVYLGRRNETGIGVSYENFNGNLTIDDYYGGSGEITDGNLAFSIGTPDELKAFSDPQHYEDEDYNAGWGSFFDDHDNVQASANVRGLVLHTLYYVDYYNAGMGRGFQKQNTTISVHGNSYSGTLEHVFYMYVENDVTVSGKGKSETYTTVEGTTYTQTITTRNFNLALKAGWNAVYTKYEFSETFTGTIDNPTSVTMTLTETMPLKNPALKWVLFDYDDPDDYSATLDRRPKMR
jgi:hypothetical protein